MQRLIILLSYIECNIPALPPKFLRVVAGGKQSGYVGSGAPRPELKKEPYREAEEVGIRGHRSSRRLNVGAKSNSVVSNIRSLSSRITPGPMSG